MKSPFAKKAKSAPELNEYSDSERTMSDEEAHRDRQYDLPTLFRQFVAVYQAQLKLIAKSKIIWLFFVAVAVIPLAVYSGMLNDVYFWKNAIKGGPGDYMAGILGLLPIAVALIPSIVLSRPIPVEFKEKTAFLNLALPQSRVTFYLAKFAAGFTMVLFTLAMVYGLVGLMAIGAKGDMDVTALLGSFLIALAASFAIGGTAFCISTFLKRGAIILPFLLFYIFIPAIVSGFLFTTDAGIDRLLMVSNAAQFLPALGGEAASALLGGPAFSFSLVGFLVYINNYQLAVNFPLTFGIYFAWGVLFLLLGLYQFMRREM